MKLNERLNVLIQSTALSQKSGVLTLDDAVKAKTAIDVISSGILNQNFAEAINALIELAVSSQKKGVFSLKDAHMVYLAIEGIENEFRYEVSRLSGGVIREVKEELEQNQPVINNNDIEDNKTQVTNEKSNKNITIIPPVTLKRI